MGLIAGGCWRLTELGVYFLTFCCSGIVLGIYSYFLSVLADRNLPISNDWKAVEGISGAACLFLMLATIPTCLCGGNVLVATLLLFLDALFVGGFIALAVLTRHGAGSCSGVVHTPLGSGPSNSQAAGYGANGFGFGSGENATYAPNLHLACRLNTAAFACSLIGAFLFLLCLIIAVAIRRNHKKDKRYGPSPANNYTAGRGRAANFAFWRKRKTDSARDDMLTAEAPQPSALMPDEKDYSAKDYSSSAGHVPGSAYGAEPAPAMYGHTAPLNETSNRDYYRKNDNPYAV